VIQVVFDQVAKTAAERKIQFSIANLLKRRLEEDLQCSCATSHAVINVGGNWRTGDFSVTDITSCCLGSLDQANNLLAAKRERASVPSSFSRTARQKSRGMFSLR